MFLAACAAFLITLPAQALFILDVSFSVVHDTEVDGSTDPNGFDGSTWTFQFISDQTNYVPYDSRYPSVIADSASLSISGATNAVYNDTFAIAEATTDFLFMPNVQEFLAYVAISGVGGPTSFTFGSPSLGVSGFLAATTSLTVTPAPGMTDLIELSDWQGLVVGDTGVTVGTGTFVFNNGIVTVSDTAAVPEPSTYAAFAGLGILGFAGLRRWRKIKA